MAEEQTSPKKERSVHIGGDVSGSTIITGDHNTVYQTILQHYPSLKDYVYDVGSTIATVTQCFVGRKFLFDWLKEAFRQYPCAYLRVIADAGLGKTAIAAEVARRYNAPIHFVDASMGITRPDQCLNHLCAQLIARYNLPHDHLPVRAGEDSGFFLQLLQEAVERAGGKPVLVVIDGLDEADRVPPGANWLLLPSRLPRGAYVLLTHRPGDYPVAADPNTPTPEPLVIAWDDPRQQADIEAHLRRQAERDEVRRALAGARPPIPVERFVAALKEASEGNFKYLDYVLADIARKEPGFDPLDLSRLPRGLVGYYETFWARMAPFPDAPDEEWERWEAQVQPVLAGLGAAGEPVTAAWLAAHAAQPEERVRRTLDRWRRFLRGEKRDGRETWRIVHRSFADFLAGKLDLRAFHRRIADYYRSDPARWGEHDGYAFRHLSAHLAAAGEFEALGRLIEDPAWYAAQRDYDPTRRAYARDVERGLELAEGQGLEGIPAVVGWSLLYGTLRTLATGVPVEALEVMAHLGEVERAIRYAELIIGPKQQAEAFRRIGLAAWERVGRCRDRYVGEALSRALAAAEGIEDAFYRAHALAAVAQALAQVGEMERARDGLSRALVAAEGIEDAFYRAHALAAVAQALAQAGEFDRALAAAEGMEVAPWRAEALAAVAQALAQVGDRDGLVRVLAAAEGIGDADDRALALAAVARAIVQVTRPGGAEATSWLHTAFRAARARGRDEVWRHIGAFAPLLGKLGVLPAAWERIRAVEEVRAYGPAPSPR